MRYEVPPALVAAVELAETRVELRDLDTFALHEYRGKLECGRKEAKEFIAESRRRFAARGTRCPVELYNRVNQAEQTLAQKVTAIHAEYAKRKALEKQRQEDRGTVDKAAIIEAVTKAKQGYEDRLAQMRQEAHEARNTRNAAQAQVHRLTKALTILLANGNKLVPNHIAVATPEVEGWIEAYNDSVKRARFILSRDKLTGLTIPAPIYDDAMVQQLITERDEARAWVERLTSEQRVLTCAFCGEVYPPGTPESNHAALTAHVKVCTKHPMRDTERVLRALMGRVLNAMGTMDSMIFADEYNALNAALVDAETLLSVKAESLANAAQGDSET